MLCRTLVLKSSEDVGWCCSRAWTDGPTMYQPVRFDVVVSGLSDGQLEMSGMLPVNILDTKVVNNNKSERDGRQSCF